MITKVPCKHCKSMVDEQYNFCPYCGTMLKEVVFYPTSNKRNIYKQMEDGLYSKCYRQYIDSPRNTS